MAKLTTPAPAIGRQGRTPTSSTMTWRMLGRSPLGSPMYLLTNSTTPNRLQHLIMCMSSNIIAAKESPPNFWLHVGNAGQTS